ncbi:MAG: DUF1844 domain-containing protein [Deltaproteobacteria bacterium]|nr:DUF1844 domain-containing protein [Deltaproteobacteria bacterium]MBI5809667.1 DUF1844 domain-containing protein [Deltaproteobacteria bacterium]
MADDAEIRGGTEGLKAGEKGAEGGSLPPLDFPSFILSLSTAVLMNLGVVENPITKQKEKEPAVAKQTIELISLLKEKTKGNLTEEEAKLLDDVLYELRLWYVRTAGQQ